MSTTEFASPIDELRHILGPCPSCEREVGMLEIIDPETRAPMTERELARILERRRGMLSDESTAGMARAIDSIRYVCGSCAMRLAAASDETRRRETAAMHKRDAYARGLMPMSALGSTFHNARAEWCARNAGAWRAAKSMPPRSLWIAGPKGVGKTHMAECVLNAALDANLTAGEVQAHAINDHGGAREDIRRDFIRRFASLDVLLIDDLDKPTFGPLGIDVLWRIADKRSRDKRATLITANYGGAELRRYWFEKFPANRSTVDTLFDRLDCTRVDMQGDSLRGAA